MQVVFLFAGHGSQYPRMGLELFETEPTFRQTMISLDRVARELLGQSLVERLYGRDCSAPITETAVGQSVTFSVQYALTCCLMARGVRPTLALGMSLGEFVAAAVFGMLDAEDALRLVIGQARCIERRCPPGGMLAVFVERARPSDGQPIPDDLEVACHNGTSHFIVSGRAESIAAYAAQLRGRGVTTYLLPVRHGFHSAAIEEARVACLAELSERRFRPARVPIISALDAEAAQTRPADHFWGVIRGPMRFDATIAALGRPGEGTLIDVGAGTLAGWLHQRGYTNAHAIVSPGGGDGGRLKRLVTAIAPDQSVSLG